MATSTAVSRYMGAKFERSTSSPSRIKGFPMIRSGFKATSGVLEEGLVIVSYEFGDSMRHASRERRSEVEDEHLGKYRAHLEGRYDVTDGLGPGMSPSPVLHVRDKSE